MARVNRRRTLDSTSGLSPPATLADHVNVEPTTQAALDHLHSLCLSETEFLERFYDVYAQFTTHHDPLPLGRLSPLLTLEVEQRLWKGVPSGLRKLCRPPEGMKRKGAPRAVGDEAGNEASEHQQGGWNMDCADAVGLFRIGKGGLTTKFVQALQAAERERYEVGAFIRELLEVAEERVAMHASRSRKRAKVQRTEARNFTPADVFTAMERLRPTGVHGDENHQEEPNEQHSNHDDMEFNDHGEGGRMMPVTNQAVDEAVGQTGDLEAPIYSPAIEEDSDDWTSDNDPDERDTHEVGDINEVEREASGDGGLRDEVKESEEEGEDEEEDQDEEEDEDDEDGEDDEEDEDDEEEESEPEQEGEEEEESEAEEADTTYGDSMQVLGMRDDGHSHASEHNVPAPSIAKNTLDTIYEESSPAVELGRGDKHVESWDESPLLPPMEPAPANFTRKRRPAAVLFSSGGKVTADKRRRLSPPDQSHVVLTTPTRHSSLHSWEDDTMNDPTPQPPSPIVTSSAPPILTQWQDAIEPVSEDSVARFHEAKAWVPADAVDYLLDVLAPPPYLVVNSSATLPTKSKTYRPARANISHPAPPMIVPMCDSTHWAVAILRPDDHTADIYDSLPPSSHAQWETRLHAFHARLPNCGFTKLAISYRNCPRQPNSYSCGLYAIVNALLAATNDSLLEPLDDPTARYLLGVAIDARHPHSSIRQPPQMACPTPGAMPGVASTSGQDPAESLRLIDEFTGRIATVRKQFVDDVKSFRTACQASLSTCRSLELVFTKLCSRLQARSTNLNDVQKALATLRQLAPEAMEVFRSLHAVGDLDARREGDMLQELEHANQAIQILQVLQQKAIDLRQSLGAQVDKASQLDA